LHDSPLNPLKGRNTRRQGLERDESIFKKGEFAGGCTSFRRLFTRETNGVFHRGEAAVLKKGKCFLFLHHSSLTPKGDLNPRRQGLERDESIFKKGEFAGGCTSFRRLFTP